MFLDEVSLKCRGDLVGCFQRVIDGQLPYGVVNHPASNPPQPLDMSRWKRHPPLLV
jgi:hypothetical protein